MTLECSMPSTAFLCCMVSSPCACIMHAGLRCLGRPAVGMAAPHHLLYIGWRLLYPRQRLSQEQWLDLKATLVAEQTPKCVLCALLHWHLQRMSGLLKAGCWTLQQSPSD